MAEQYSTVYVHHNFIHSSVDGHLGCFHATESLCCDLELTQHCESTITVIKMNKFRGNSKRAYEKEVRIEGSEFKCNWNDQPWCSLQAEKQMRLESGW